MGGTVVTQKQSWIHANPAIICGDDGSGNVRTISIDNDGNLGINNQVWDVATLAWVSMQQPLIKTDTLTVSVDFTSVETLLDKLVGFEIPSHDYIALTYVAAGGGIGEIETVVYKTGGSGGTTVGTLTLAYDGSDNLISITRS